MATPAPSDGDQLALVPSGRPRPRRPRASGPKTAAAVDPVAQVAVDTPLAHLDRPFDYLVPETMADTAVPGARVRVRFAGSDTAGLVLTRVAGTDFAGALTPVTRVVSPVPVLTAEVAGLVRAVADRYAGTFSDVVRAAVPPRHARTEAAVVAAAGVPAARLPGAAPEAGPWAAYGGGAALVSRLAGSRPGDPAPRAVWTAAPDERWAAAMARLAAAAQAADRGVLWLVPDARDVAEAAAALDAELGDGSYEVLTADLGPAARYRAFLRVLLGEARVVVGTRAAAFAPVGRLGLVMLWDDGDDLYSEPHAPGWHAREVALLRAEREGAALVVGAVSRSVEAAVLVTDGTARPVVPHRAAQRSRGPRVVCAGDDADLAADPAARSARLPHVAWEAARRALEQGPVLVQVPRRGYLPSLACQRCRAPARCVHCHGPLAATSGHAIPTCRWCARPAGDWSCPACGGRRLRAVTVGAGRTAEELGRAFPGVAVRTSGRSEVLAEVPAGRSLVVATPGAEPRVEGGYAAALLLDGRVMLDRPDLRAGEEALRRWMNAVSLVRPAADGGRVVLMADAALPVAQALVRLDPAGFAERERAERLALGLPPAVAAATVTGAADDVASALALLEVPDGVTVLGPAELQGRSGPDGPVGPVRVRALVTAPRSRAAGLAAALAAMAAVRSARKDGGPVQVRVDPAELG